MTRYAIELCPDGMDPPMKAWVKRGSDIICMCWFAEDASMIVSALNYALDVSDMSAWSEVRCREFHKRNA